ncbi:DUF3533 domain-containing protein [Flexivirga sp. ID2601S]|uniref:DUF3533 domain-containing protein n=1 Tax=Flexivirga aerilata TaxID=1656889 RepID=A0A849AJ68_9MICO|nr:DUF3533 domain-containing protein [Flexivirga aerilata]NNG39381.1 DUF3533 domain-containing protein [Flexivirga aerilata]
MKQRTIGVRVLWLAIVALGVQAVFVLTYAGAFESGADRLRVTVVSPDAGWAGLMANRINSIDGEPIWADIGSDRASAEQLLRQDDLQAVLVFDPQQQEDLLLTSSAQGQTAATGLRLAITQIEASQGRTVRAQDITPVQPGDPGGVTGYYLVTCWVVSGYLFAALLVTSRDIIRRPQRHHPAWWLLGSVVFAAAAGLSGAFLVTGFLGALDAALLSLAAVGALVVLTGAVVTLALTRLFGAFGLGVSVLALVAVGGPSAGGAYGFAVLPPVWSGIVRWLPGGAGVDAVRKLTYFAADGLALPLGTLIWWLVLGGLVVVLAGVNAPAATRSRPGRHRAAPARRSGRHGGSSGSSPQRGPRK